MRQLPWLPATFTDHRLSLPAKLVARSRYLLLELPALAAEIDERWGRITRITVNPAQWPVIPPRIPVTGHTVHAGWFTTEQDEHTIAVFSYAPRRLNLLVVPPATDAVDAARLMSEASRPGQHPDRE
ncbi:DUF5994 family protein [Kitasatospora aureofaciens]|uniref:DUF5994 family protein n=1 Tax=Kitasatospora aureofaciens TaxID=1894 RepID=UPI001C46C5E1|nr:DUF5994 family protein [Kitasatospora aureofaciens]MBV6700435.1 hypothetical protein [Kitasatospora aureofaciens]